MIEVSQMPASIDSHKPDCRCNACRGRRQGGRSKPKLVGVRVEAELAEWVAEKGGPAFLRRLALAARRDESLVEAANREKDELDEPEPS